MCRSLASCCLALIRVVCLFFLQENRLEGGIVSLTFDDGYSCQYEAALPLLEKYGIAATFYITAGVLGQPGYLTTDQVASLSQKGHEIGSHCTTHRNLKKLPPKEIEGELLESKLILENLVKSPVEHFAAPFGAWNVEVMRQIKKYYKSSRTIAPGMNTCHGLNPFFIHAHVALRTTSPSDVERWVKEAETQEKWLVLVYHRIDREQNIVSIEADSFAEHLKIIQLSSLKPATIGEALLQICSTSK